MRFSEVLDSLRDGKKVARKDWGDVGSYWFVRDDLIYYFDSYDSSSREVRIDSGHLLADDWYVVDEKRFLPPGKQIFAPKPNLDRLEARLTYLELLHDVVHHDGPIEKPSYRQIMKHIGDLWRHVE